MFTKQNFYSLLIGLSQPQVIRFALLVIVLLVSKSGATPSLTCDISCGSGVGG
ncbi:MAG: hypothetical protein HUU38_25500 [Anaerolineales bacterium]|jgi:hypothetical protein|nr:hypothetical protein [Anaerolineales bacterium]